MIRKLIAPALIAAIAVVVPGSSEVVRAQKTRFVRLATLAPRGTELYIEFKKFDRRLRKATNNQWGVRIYAGGMAGDEKDMIRKMRVGQMDSAVITNVGLSQVVREVAVLDAPGVIETYAQLEAVQKEMNEEWEEMVLRKNFKLLSWWEAGQYRLFSKGTVQSLNDLRAHRVWLWPDSIILKELWRAVGANGVPLALPDVFGALETGMVDLLIATPVALVALQWQRKLDHMSRYATGVLIMSWIMSKSSWDGLPPEAKAEIEKLVVKNTERAKKIARREDAAAYKKLLNRGYTEIIETPKQHAEMEAIFAKVRKQLTGRVFPASLIKRVQGIASCVQR